MGYWKGIMKSENCELEVSINYHKKENIFQIDWDGSGLLEKTCPFQTNMEIKTNIGTIKITEILSDNEKKHIIRFIGINNPTGKLEYDINRTL